MMNFVQNETKPNMIFNNEKIVPMLNFGNVNH